jgi:glycosyltransferase involved in cell wall biosynthesis
VEFTHELRMAKTLKDQKLPTISVITPSYDGALETLKKCLTIVRSQSYPQEKIEIILGHGGSETIIKPIARTFKASYVLIPKEKQNAEYNRGIAFLKAKNELVLILDHDNFMPTPNFLREYVEPFLNEKVVVAVESCYYHYDRSMSIMDRYFALLGGLDPVPFYFGKNDRLMWNQKKWNLFGKAEEKEDYFVVTFEKDPRRIPTVGTNGCMMRRKTVMENANVKPGWHYPIDVMVDTIMSGYNTYAFTKNSIIHETGSRGIYSFLKRRLIFMRQYHFEDNSKRRFSVYMKGDLPKLLVFILYAVTIVKPLYDSIRGFIRIPDIAWFIHPIMCFGIAGIYTYGTVTGLLHRSKTLSSL